jgi:hypothetical protein
VYVAYPGVPYQIEIFDPKPAVALRLAVTGQIVPVGPATIPTKVAGVPKVVSVADLRNLSSSLGHSVFWAGAIPNTTFELTQTSDGRAYIRYLPRGVNAGNQRPYLTIGTYPVRDAVAAVESIAGQAGAKRLAIANGTAVVDPAHPTSVYLAFRGSNLQIEVFDPNAARARQFVPSGRVVPIR